MLQRIAIASVGLASLIVMMSPVATSDESPPNYSITTQQDTDKVVVFVENDRTLFTVQSQLGIGHATIERTIEKWPEQVILRLNVKITQG